MMRTKLSLGSGNLIEDPKEWINHDLVKHRKEIDITFDLNIKQWSVKDDYGNNIWFDEIKAWDVIEHLDDPINFMNNCWHLLKEGGILYIKACGWQNPNYWVDITHKHPFDVKSFDYFSLDTDIGKEYNYYVKHKWRFLEDYPKYDRHKNVIVKMTPIK